MSAAASLTRYTFAPAGPLFYETARDRLAPLLYFRRGLTIVNDPLARRPWLISEFVSFYAAERAAALLAPLLSRGRLWHDGRRWIVDGDVAGDWS